jgi:hypothetical protein
MTRTDVMASSRPRKAGAASMRGRSSSVLRGLSITSFLLMLALALAPGAAVAAEPTSGYSTTTPPPTTTGYSQTPTTPTTTTTTKTTPSTGTLPSKEAEKPTTSTPSTEPSPEKTSSTPTTTTAAKSGTLPFTGFDLRWDIGLGLLLLAAGFSIVVMQRRQRRDSGS